MADYKLQDKFLEEFFSESFASDFYLTGGTALSRFYLNHRESDDIDLFTQNQKIDFSHVNFLVLRILNKLNLKIIKQINTDTFLQYITKDEKGDLLKIDFVKEIPVHFGEFKIVGKTRVDSIENIGSNKVLTIFGRRDAKDFIDLYFILQKTKLRFDYLYNLAIQKDLGLSEFYLANSMRQIENISIYPKMLVKLDKNKLIKFYSNLAEKLIKRVKPE
ncbi:MAG: nucleotidyl transferase AbiEii/AbiGii toxin family protein [Patescibacteria group bacterium]